MGDVGRSIGALLAINTIIINKSVAPFWVYFFFELCSVIVHFRKIFIRQKNFQMAPASSFWNARMEREKTVMRFWIMHGDVLLGLWVVY